MEKGNQECGKKYYSVHDISREDQIKVYPVPASDRIWIENDGMEDFYYEIFNVRGYLEKKGNLKGSKVSVNISDLPSGIYFLKLTSEKGWKVKKIVRNNPG